MRYIKLFKKYQIFHETQYDFPFIELDNIINELEDFSMILIAQKYNL
jgi:hypothetical protein